MNIRNIAELIILQGIEDLWNESERDGSAHFFLGEWFPMCADIAGMDQNAQNRLLNMIDKAMEQSRGRREKPEYEVPALQYR